MLIIAKNTRGVHMKKAIKKIVALGMGASLVGATLLGAGAAADLNDFPGPFVTGGKFSGTLVVGDNAAAQDVVGVSDIAMSLQFASSVQAGTGSSSTTTVQGDAFRIADSGDALNLYQPLHGVIAVLDNGDLNALADGTFKAKTSVSYTQTLSVPHTEVQFVVDSDAAIEDPQLYLVLNSSEAIIDYDLVFTTQAESDIDSDDKYEDWEDEKISMAGKEYTITKAEQLTGQASTAYEITMMSGAVQDTLEVGQTKTYTINGKDYEVTVMVVSGDTTDNAVTKMIINDEVTKSLSKDETYTLKDGIDVGIKEVLPTKSGDVVQNLVEFYLGAEKLVLNGKTGAMDIGDETISDVTITMTGENTSSLAKLSSIEIKWLPTETYYVPAGGKLSEVVTDNDDYEMFLDKIGVDYQFEGLDSSPTEDLKFSPSGKRNYKIEFTNRKGVEYSQKVFYINTSQTTVPPSLGEDGDDPLFNIEGEEVCDNDYFIVENNKNSRILRMMDVSTSETTITLKDVGTGDSTTHSYTVSGTDLISNFVMDGATYQVNVSDASGKCVTLNDITDDTTGRANLWTEFDTKITLYKRQEHQAGDNNSVGAAYFMNKTMTSINITEDLDGKEESSTDIDQIRLNFTYDSSDGLDLSVAQFDTMESASSGVIMINLDSDDNTNEGYTQWGNLIRQSSTDNQDKWEFVISKDEAVAKVFMTAGVTSIATVGGAEGDTVIVSRIDVGATKLASEVAGLEKTTNLILVGGPCANAAVEAASADFPTCSGWDLDPGEGILQLVEQDSGAVALLVAGTMAEDTRTATSIVSEMTLLNALADGVMKQKIVVSTGALVDMPAAVVEEAEE